MIPRFFLICALLAGPAAAEPILNWDLREANWKGQQVNDSTVGKPAKSPTKPTFADGAPVFGEEVYLDVPGIVSSDLPTKVLSVEARVRIRKGQQWGSLIGFMQDNGDYERGWSLGYNDKSFLFWLSTGGKMISVASTEPFKLNEWATVVATFDGKKIRLFVDGKPAGERDAVGEIAYPDEARLTIGGYRDSNEFYAMQGEIAEAKIYDHVLTEAEVASGKRTSNRLNFAIRPSARFLDSTRAELRWAVEGSDEPVLVEFGQNQQLENSVRSNSGVTILTGLEPQRLYFYRITQGKKRSPVYELNNALNFSKPPTTKPIRHDAETGYRIYLSAENPDEIADFALENASSIVVFDTSAERVAAARKFFYEAGIYGSRVTVTRVESLQQLPVTSCFADRVISRAEPTNALLKEIDRILAPGGVAVLPDKAIGKPRPDDFGEWTHQYGDSGNSAASGDSLSGARSTSDFQVQWVGRPGADFGLDRQSRMPAPLAVNGRLFHQGMNRIVALRAANGAVLWSMEIPDLLRLNMPRDSSNWCADDARLYVAMHEKSWVLDAETGELETALKVPDGKNWGHIARAGDKLLGSSIAPNSGYTGYWSKSMWFDGKAGSQGSEIVCSDSIFAYSTKTFEPVWDYRNGLILNPTIAAHSGRVVFVESRNSGEEFWEDQFLVALDLDTGSMLWERPIDTEDGLITFYLQASDDAILISASNTAYHLYTFDPKTGEPIWNRTTPWPDDHHSGHIQHPVILNKEIYLQPNGFDLLTGEILTTKMGARSGCHTYIGARDSLIYRGADRMVSIWDRETEKVSSWERLRPSCWLSLIPANGMLLVPEGGGGCSCGGWMETSIGFAPRGLLNLETR
ncbi:MAG: outer membrane protein assembly factor BamB [Verrucomicrobiales bacterium]